MVRLSVQALRAVAVGRTPARWRPSSRVRRWPQVSMGCRVLGWADQRSGRTGTSGRSQVRVRHAPLPEAQFRRRSQRRALIRREPGPLAGTVALPGKVQERAGLRRNSRWRSSELQLVVVLDWFYQKVIAPRPKRGDCEISQAQTKGARARLAGFSVGGIGRRQWAVSGPVRHLKNGW